MLQQLSFTQDGRVRDKVQASIDILKMFEPPDGYYLAFSGGKDSQCIYHLAKMAGVKFDAHYNVTSVDPPELVRFIKDQYPDVSIDIPHDADGKPITMWNLIAQHTIPPTRKVRYCCSGLKEINGKYRVVLTGVRKSESINRKKNQGMVTIQNKSKRLRKELEERGVDFTQTDRGGVVLNYDNDNSKLMVEHCYRTTKTLVNPIIDWEEEDVWAFLNENGIPHCSLYDEGFKRLGCIGCPMSGSKNMARDFERWPKYKELYIRAFQKMIDNHPGDIKVLNPDADTKFKITDKSSGGGTMDGVVDQVLLVNGSGGTYTVLTDEKCSGGGTGTVLPMVATQHGLNTSSETGKTTAECGTALSEQSVAMLIFDRYVEMGAI